MFKSRKPKSRVASAAGVVELIYHNTVRNVRKTHANAVIAILMNILQTVIFVLAFYLLFAILGMRGSAIRGDFLLYIMTGVYLYMVHTRTVKSVLGSEGPTAAIMKHAPMTTAVTISSAALGTLYIQILSMVVITYVYHVGWGPIHIHYWPGALSMIVLAWFSGMAVGMCFLAIKPWAPNVASTCSSIYTRVNMLASGKMFVANALPGYMLVWFDWNPLFHAIDQARGFTFVNYFPRNSSLDYPVAVSLGVLLLGLMGEFYSRRNASVSWEGRR